MLVYPLTTPGIDPQFAGTKGAILALLHKSGLPIPFTLLISAEAFDRYFKFTELVDRVREMLPNPLPTDPLELARLSAEARLLFQDTPLPDYLEEELVTNLSAFDSALIMVRSSFINHTRFELPSGIFDHVSKSRGQRSLIHSIRSIWSSLYSVPALTAFAKAGIDPLSCRMAVIAHRYVPAVGIGSVHTVHPATGSRADMLVRFEPQGTKLGSTSEPTQWTVDRHAASEIQKQIIPSSGQHPLLSTENMSELLAIAKEVEDIFHMPARIDFAVTKKARGNALNGSGKVYIIQADPMRDIPDAPISWAAPAQNRIYQWDFISAGIHHPVTPLFGSLGLRTLNIIGSTEDKKEGQFEIATINGWAFTGWPFSGKKAPILLKAWFSMFLELIDQPEDTSEHGALELQKLVALEADKSYEQASLAEQVELCRRVMVYVSDVVKGFQQNASSTVGAIRMIYNAILLNLSTRTTTLSNQPRQASKYMPSSVIQAAQQVADRVTNPTLRQMISNHPVIEISRSLATGTSPVPTLDEDWLAFSGDVTHALDGLPDVVFDLDFSQPTLRSSPELFITMVQDALNGKLDQNGEAEMTSEQINAILSATYNKSLARFFIPFANQAVDWGKNLELRRSGCLSAISIAYPFLRSTLLRVGSQLVEGGLLDSPDSIFWLYENELLEIVDDVERWDQRLPFDEIIALRKRDWREWQDLTPPHLVPTDHWFSKMFYPS